MTTHDLIKRGSAIDHELEYPWEDGHGYDQFAGSSPAEELVGLKSWFHKRKVRSARARSKKTWLDYAGQVLPCLTWLRTYRLKEFLLFDLLAGIAVGFTVVPQGMSYANIAGVPAVYGLYGAFTPVLTYALFGSCRQLGVGPVAVTSGLIYSGLAGVVPGYEKVENPNDPGAANEAAQATYNKTVIQLAFLVACLYTAVGVLQLGFLIRFLSQPVITGFTSGAALTIASGQIKYLLGISYKKQDTLQGEWGQIAAGLSKPRAFVWQEFVMGMSMVFFLVALKWIGNKKPKLFFLKALGPFLACVIGIAVVAGCGFSNGKGPIKIVKNVPSGMPHFTVGQWAPVSFIDKLLPLAFIVMAVDLLESTSIARALARKNNYKLAYNQEIVALGIANFVGAAFNSYTTTGSFSRSAINNSCGAKTQLAGFITSIIVMCVLLFLTPIFRLMPYNTMGAIIIVGVSSLVEIPVAVELFKVHFRDFLVWLTAFLVTCFAGVELGLLTSIILSLVILVVETAFPHVATLGRIDKTNVYRSVEKYPTAQQSKGVLVLRLDAPLFFANAPHFENAVEKMVEEANDRAADAHEPGVKFLVIDLGPVAHCDSTGAFMLKQLTEDLAKQSIQLVLANPAHKVVNLLERVHLFDVLPKKWVVVHVHDAVKVANRAMAAEAFGELGGCAVAGGVGDAVVVADQSRRE